MQDNNRLNIVAKTSFSTVGNNYELNFNVNTTMTKKDERVHMTIAGSRPKHIGRDSANGCLHVFVSVDGEVVIPAK